LPSSSAVDDRERIRQAREARAQRGEAERSSSGWFVTGTDTGVGKTVVACALLRALRERGVDAGGMKPIETGVGAGGPRDAIALRAAAGDLDPLDLVCPQRFALPAAPTVAAAAEGRRVDRDAVRRAFAALAARHARLVVEGAGGLLAPAAEDASMADLAAELGLPLLVVARASLGTINHTRLTLEAAAARALPVAGVVISHGAAPLSAADQANFASLRAELGARLVGEIPTLAPGRLPGPRCLDLGALGFV
jgi:dethiobiotin synthetase